MGLDLGYNLYEKKPFDTENKLVEVKTDDYDERWMCGRCAVNYSWGDLFEFNHEKTIVPVFQKSLDGKAQKLEEYEEDYKFYSFDEFKRHILEAVQRVYSDALAAKSDARKRIKEREEQIKELRELQKDCSAEQEYAFNRWADEIDELKAANIEDKKYIESYEEDDYDYWHAKRIEELVRLMEEDLKEDKYYVIPYYSF